MGSGYHAAVDRFAPFEELESAGVIVSTVPLVDEYTDAWDGASELAIELTLVGQHFLQGS